MASLRMATLLSTISENTQLYQNYYTSKGLSLPDHHSNPSNGPSELPLEIEAARQAAKEACSELQELLSNPVEVVMEAGPAASSPVFYFHRSRC
jgi:hypothetical protein